MGRPEPNKVMSRARLVTWLMFLSPEMNNTDITLSTLGTVFIKHIV